MGWEISHIRARAGRLARDVIWPRDMSARARKTPQRGGEGEEARRQGRAAPVWNGVS